MSDIDKPDPEPEPWERAAMDVPMTLSDMEAVCEAFVKADMPIPDNLNEAMERAGDALRFIRDLTKGGYRASGPRSAP